MSLAELDWQCSETHLSDEPGVSTTRLYRLDCLVGPKNTVLYVHVEPKILLHLLLEHNGYRSRLPMSSIWLLPVDRYEKAGVWPRCDVLDAIGTFITSHCIQVLLTSCTLIQEYQWYHINRPSQLTLHSVRPLGPRSARVLRFTYFAPTGRNVPRNHSSIFLEKSPSPRLQYTRSHKNTDVSIDTHAS